eukprot:Skav206321  [mRNA]  locus=scaffold1420:105778:106920:+ [translate_table: standard]
MNWWCTECQVNNAEHMEYCQSCKKHWTATWKKRRSRSAQHRKEKEKAKKEKEKQEPREVTTATKDNVQTDAAWNVIPEGMPWVTSTPQAHLAHREAAGSMKTPEIGIPPPPTLPPPPAVAVTQPPAALTPEEQQALSHLKGLMSLGVGLPKELVDQFQALEAKEKESSGGKQLTHTHLHKLNRLRSQVQTAEQKIVNLDAEWSTFVKTITQKLQIHGQCYQQYRADLMEAYNKKLADLNAAKHEVSQASQVLTGQVQPNVQLAAAADVEGDFANLQAMLAQAGCVDQVYTVSDDGMDEEELRADSPSAMEPNVKDARLKPAKHTTYRAPKAAPFGKATQSPQKVQQAHLKRNQAAEQATRREEKEREKESKEEAEMDEKL